MNARGAFLPAIPVSLILVMWKQERGEETRPEAGGRGSRKGFI